MTEPIELSQSPELPEGAEELFTKFEEEVIKDQSIDQLAKMYRDVYDDVEEIGKQLRRLEAKKAALGEQFCKILLLNGLNSVKTDEGSFAPKVEHCVSVMNEKALEIIEEAGHGSAIKRKIEWQTLNKIYREDEAFRSMVLEDEDNKDLFKTWDKHGIRIRRAND